MLSDTNTRLVAARRLTGRRARRESGLFLAEGAQAVREAIAADAVVELFVTAQASAHWDGLLTGLPVRCDVISDKAAAALSETVTPQGLVAVCRIRSSTIEQALVDSRLVVVLVDTADPGNLGTIIRTADAVGADAVIVDGGADPWGGKAVRAAAGSSFHLPVLAADTATVLAATAAAGMQTLATSGHGTDDLDQLDDAGALVAPTAWLFGNEARGLPEQLLSAARTVRVPIYGRAESFNVAAAATICLYASARAQRRATPMR